MRARLRVGRLLLPAAVLPGAARGGHGAPRACPAPGGAPPAHPPDGDAIWAPLAGLIMGSAWRIHSRMIVRGRNRAMTPVRSPPATGDNPVRTGS